MIRSFGQGGGGHYKPHYTPPVKPPSARQAGAASSVSSRLSTPSRIPARSYFGQVRTSPTLRKTFAKENMYSGPLKKWKELELQHNFVRANIDELPEAKLADQLRRIHLPAELPTHSKEKLEENKRKLEKIDESFIVAKSSPEVVRAKRASSYSQALPEVIDALTKRMFGRPTPAQKAEQEYGHVFDPEANDLDVLEKRNRQKVERHQNFLSDIQNIIKTSKTHTQVVETLEVYMYDEKAGGIERFSADELNRLLVQLWNHHGEEAIIEMMIETENQVFKQDPLSLEILAKSFLKSSGYFSPFAALSIANLMLSKNPENVEALIILAEAHKSRFYFARAVYDNIVHGKLDPEIVEHYQTCFPYEESIDLENVKENIIDTLALSLEFSETAFKQNFDPKLGLKVMLTQLELESIQNTPYEGRNSNRNAELIQLACIRDDVLFSRNLPLVTAFVEASYVNDSHGEILPKIEAQMLALCKTLKDTEETIKKFETLHRLYPSAKTDAMLNKLMSHYLEISKDRESAAKAVEARTKEYTAIKINLSPETVGWNLKTYSYEGQTHNVIEGNLMARGGQLPSHEINRYTKAYFQQILATPLGQLIGKDKLPPKVTPDMRLLDIDDVDLQMDLFDRFLREQFLTDELSMEVLDSPGHKMYDSVVNGSLKLRGVREDQRKAIKDDRTNLAYHLHTRLGDCRQNAQSKQLLFNLLREAQVNEQLRNISDAQDSQDYVGYDNAQIQFSMLMSRSLKLWEMEIGYGDPDHFNKIESHVTNVLLSQDEMQNVEEVSIRDAFYQGTYPFKNCKIAFQGKDPSKAVFVVGKITKDGKEYDLLVKSARYAGPKDRYDKTNTQNHFIGLPERQYAFQETLAMRPAISERHRDILLWNELDEYDAREKAKAKEQSK